MSGALGGGSVLVHCGGYDTESQRYTRDCFVMAVTADGTLQLSAAAPLPRRLAYSCHASDGERLVVAGGGGDKNDEQHNEVLLLEGLNTTWRTSTAQLGDPKDSQAGVLLGDTLLCLGGMDSVGSRGQWDGCRWVGRGCCGGWERGWQGLGGFWGGLFRGFSWGYAVIHGGSMVFCSFILTKM